MAFEPVSKKRKVKLGVIKESSKTKSLFLKINPECDLILYVPETKEYFKVLKTQLNVLEDESGIFEVEVDLDNPKQLEFLTKE